MFAGGLILSATLILFAIWLHHNEQIGWEHERDDSELDQSYLARRSRGRRRVHIMLGLSGVLILIATAFGPSVIWGVCWMLVIVSLLVVVLMAMLDAVRTHRYHAQKLPEIQRRLLGEEE